MTIEEAKEFNSNINIDGLKTNDNIIFYCENCGVLCHRQKRSFNRLKLFCSKCSSSLYQKSLTVEERQKQKAKYKQTCLARYGVESVLSAASVRQKIEATNIEKYGVDNPFKSIDTQRRIHDKLDYTKIGRNVSKSKQNYSDDRKSEIKEKRKSTIEKLGREEFYSDITEKTKKTKLDRYGSACYNNLTKHRNTCLDRYGVESYSQTKEFRQESSKKLKVSSKFKTASDIERHEWLKKASKKYSFDNLTFDSSWELAYFIYLVDHNIEFTYQCDPIEYYDYDNTRHFYIPDFNVNGELIEIKGDHFFESATGKFINPFDRSEKMDLHCQSKYECMIEHNVRILKNEDMQPILDYVSSKYGKDYLRSFKH